jgi:hypothetical protein
MPLLPDLLCCPLCSCRYCPVFFAVHSVDAVIAWSSLLSTLLMQLLPVFFAVHYVDAVIARSSLLSTLYNL